MHKYYNLYKISLRVDDYQNRILHIRIPSHLLANICFLYVYYLLVKECPTFHLRQQILQRKRWFWTTKLTDPSENPSVLIPDETNPFNVNINNLPQCYTDLSPFASLNFQ